jgi:hypothetical protein
MDETLPIGFHILAMPTPIRIYFHEQAVCIWMVVRLFRGSVELFKVIAFVIYFDKL